MLDATNAEDEYAMYDDFSDLTEEQLAQIDAVTSPVLASTSKSLSHVQVELEGQLEGTTMITEPYSNSLGDSSKSKSKEAQHISPLQQFRRNRIFSVTDLVSPAWCEVQFDYGLRQQRHRKLQYRPASFVTEQGKEIIVDQGVAAKSDATKKTGSIVHRKLEREIRPEEINVEIETEEERWALRIINMIDCVDSLLLLGCAREMPVFGLVEGNAVVGVIDEITYSLVSPSSSYDKKRGFHSSPSTPQKPKRTRRSPSPSQPRITKFMSPAKAPVAETFFTSDPPPSSSSHLNTSTLHLIDTKTRRTNSLPRDEDALPSRLQLMLYHRMLTNLMSTSGSFDFSSFWQQLGLNDTAPFSKNFLAQTLLARETNSLRHLTDLWHLAVSRLNGAKIDSTLQLIYRLQPDRQRSFQNRNRSAQATSSREEMEIAKAIEASLQDVQLGPSTERLAQALAQSVTDPEAGSSVLEQEKKLVDDPELLWALEQSLLTRIKETGLDPTATQNDENPTVQSDIFTQYQDTNKSHHTAIIGTKEFEFDSHFLDEYLIDVMKWWNGEREPRGVTLEQTGHCFSCEYYSGCEWREQKAREVEDRLELRRKQNNCYPFM
ncbi:exonuclease V [Lentinula aff. detonsa]|uniref:Exonuclease V n=1 Tax=Lentinula aff. detonsa TaxID=2804958 RepID=A0AA38NQI9_9AGAR|nr:exonuclease V [Lentinula aff. detonsa]